MGSVYSNLQLKFHFATCTRCCVHKRRVLKHVTQTAASQPFPSIIHNRSIADIHLRPIETPISLRLLFLFINVAAYC